MAKPSRQVVYIEIDEEITSVFDRIKNIRKAEILLVVPRKAMLFQSLINLKILKSKMADKGKKLIIVTTDRNGKHLAEKVGLKVMSRIEVKESKAQSDETPQMKIQPIQARRNEEALREETPQRFTEKKISIRELISDFRMKSRHGKRHVADYSGSFQFVKPSRKFLILIILVSFGLFSLISYIALPSATIYIRPKFDYLDFTVNVTLADKRKNQNLLKENRSHVIASEFIRTTTKQTKIFSTASSEFNGKNAKGEIRIVNTSNEEWKLQEGTRFKSEEGIIFRIAEGVFVPPRIRDEYDELTPGTLTVKVEADPFDALGQPAGAAGNLSPRRFTIPGLSKFNQRLIWGESDEFMTGGVTDYRKVVTKSDITAAKKQIEDNLILMAREDLRTYIEEVNQLNQTKLTLLDDSRYLKTKLVDLRISDDLEGSYRDKFEIFAKIDAEGLAFNFDQLFALLKVELGSRTHPDMRLREDSINPDNVTYEVIDEDELLGQIKITATIKGIEEFVIDSVSQSGIRFGAKVKEKVINLRLEEAENLIGNLSEVEAVEIKIWPIWINKLPRIPESIEIKLMES